MSVVTSALLPAILVAMIAAWTGGVVDDVEEARPERLQDLLDAVGVALDRVRQLRLVDGQVVRSASSAWTDPVDWPVLMPMSDSDAMPAGESGAGRVHRGAHVAEQVLQIDVAEQRARVRVVGAACRAVRRLAC